MTHFDMNSAESSVSVAKLILFICMQLQSDTDTMRQERCLIHAWTLTCYDFGKATHTKKNYNLEDMFNQKWKCHHLLTHMPMESRVKSCKRLK